jgi:YidC/Oxa1 family membrane protein insertase
MIKNILLFLVIFLSLNLILKSCQPSEEQTSILDQGDFGFITTENTYSRTDTIEVEMKNNTEETITIPSSCPEEPFNVLHYENAEWVQITSTPEINCEEAVEYVLEPGQSAIIPYDNWSYSLFSQMGRFKVAYTLGEKTYETNEFIVEEEGVFSKLWNAILYRPTYNALIFFAYVVPGHSLGLAIILLTILIRTLLLAPSQKAMKAQRRMQEIQPKLEAIKEKYKGDQAKISQETMALWKEQKVNPMGSCLPLLFQLPVLLALFWVIKSGLNPDKIHLLYTTYENFSLSNINTQFLGMDLMKVNIYVLPLIVGLLQFVQMKLTMAKTAGGKKKGKEMAIANNMMTYMMPVMIAVFTASLPAGVGIYWGTSTFYGIFQQYFVNKGGKGKKKGKDDKNSDDVKVRVIENNS